MGQRVTFREQRSQSTASSPARVLRAGLHEYLFVESDSIVHKAFSHEWLTD